jgi:hypothetical protein
MIHKDQSLCLQPLSSLFIPDLRPKAVQRPPALPRPTSIPVAARQIPWDTWRDVREFKVKTREEIKQEMLAFERGVLQIGVIISMPTENVLDKNAENSRPVENHIWDLGVIAEPWSVGHNMKLVAS